MANYRISGVWKDHNGVITHYAFHEIREGSVDFAKKYDKAKAVALIEQKENSATTWIWNYKLAKWDIGSAVHVVDGKNGRFLRSNHDGTERDNLDHLIDYDWLRNLFK